jgi:hypothetical protein
MPGPTLPLPNFTLILLDEHHLSPCPYVFLACWFVKQKDNLILMVWLEADGSIRLQEETDCVLICLVYLVVGVCHGINNNSNRIAVLLILEEFGAWKSLSLALRPSGYCM